MHHEEGYTSFPVYLHNATAPLIWGGGAASNVLAVYVDATQPELWCYEGGGIYRHVWLESGGLVSVTPWGQYTKAYVPLAAISSPQGANGPQIASTATLMPQVGVGGGG
jgi:hypothetical protein